MWTCVVRCCWRRGALRWRRGAAIGVARHGQHGQRRLGCRRLAGRGCWRPEVAMGVWSGMEGCRGGWRAAAAPLAKPVPERGGADLAACARRLPAAQQAGMAARLVLHHLQALDAGARRGMRGSRRCWGVVPAGGVPVSASLWPAPAPRRFFWFAATVWRFWSVPFCCGSGLGLPPSALAFLPSTWAESAPARTTWVKKLSSR